jgi:hypothetical protein
MGGQAAVRQDWGFWQLQTVNPLGVSRHRPPAGSANSGTRLIRTGEKTIAGRCSGKTHQSHMTALIGETYIIFVTFLDSAIPSDSAGTPRREVTVASLFVLNVVVLLTRP